MTQASCVVCDLPAKVYCEADKAFLCAECDHKVHSSNPLAARHTRFPVCELCKGTASAVFCCNDKAYLCDLCDTAVHSENPLAARHVIIPATQALAGNTDAAEESDAQSECARQEVTAKAKPIAEEAGAGCGDESAAIGGSEAVVPVLDLPTFSEGAAGAASAANSDAAALKAPWGKDTFDFLDLDNGWLDMGLDFSDILAEAPSEGLVPTFQAPAEEADDDLGAVPVLDMDLMGEHNKSLSMSCSLSLDLSVPSSFQVPFAGPPAEVQQQQQQHMPAPLQAPMQACAQAPMPAAGPATAALVQQQAQYELPAVQAQQQFFQGPPGSVWQTIYPAIQASPFYPNPSAFPVVTKDQAALNREQRVNRYREKRKTRKFEKTIRYASRKAYAEVRPRIKGRFARKDEIEAWARGEDAVVPEL